MTVADIVEIVYMSNADTVMAWAFRKAVGMPDRPKRKAHVPRADDGTYDGMRECFENAKRVRI